METLALFAMTCHSLLAPCEFMIHPVSCFILSECFSLYMESSEFNLFFLGFHDFPQPKISNLKKKVFFFFYYKAFGCCLNG